MLNPEPRRRGHFLRAALQCLFLFRSVSREQSVVLAVETSSDVRRGIRVLGELGIERERAVVRQQQERPQTKPEVGKGAAVFERYVPHQPQSPAPLRLALRTHLFHSPSLSENTAVRARAATQRNQVPLFSLAGTAASAEASGNVRFVPVLRGGAASPVFQWYSVGSSCMQRYIGGMH